MPSLPPTFRPHGARTEQERKRDLDRRRGGARARGYSPRWDKTAKGYKLHNPLCLGCQAVGRVTVTEVVDHIIPHKGDMALLWNPENWQPTCRPHHDVIKAKLELMFEKGECSVADLRLDSALAKRLTLAHWA